MGRVQRADLLFCGHRWKLLKDIYLADGPIHSHVRHLARMAGLHWDHQLEGLQVAFPCSGLRVVGRITGQLMALRNSVPANRVKAT